MISIYELRNKKWLIVAVVLCLLIVIASIFFVSKLSKKNQIKPHKDYTETQKAITDKYNQSPQSIDLSDKTISLKGNVDATRNFSGTYIVDGVEKDIKRENNSIFTKDSGTDVWQPSENTLLRELNIIAHPEYIQILSQIEDIKIGDSDCNQYSILFEKPDQAIVKEMAPEELERLRIYGTIAVTKDTKQLLRFRYHLGKDSKDEITLNITPVAK